jgi:tetratricopeptide (TPR) repeat protein
MGTRTHRRLLLWTVSGLVLASVCAVILWQAQAPDADSEADEFKDVRRALQSNDFPAARKLIEGNYPQVESEQKFLLAARVARRSDDCAGAEHLLALREDKFGKTKAGFQEWILLGVQQGDFGELETPLLESIGQPNRDTPLVLEALAKGYHAAQRPEAVPVLQRLLESEPDHVPALLLRGEILDTARQTEMAEKDFRLAVDLAPNNVSAQIALAGLLSRAGRTREALDHYELALAQEPENARALLGIARALCDDADLAGARKHLDHLLAHQPENVEGLVARARLCLRQGKAKDAEPILQRAVLAAPMSRDAQQLYLTVLTELGKKDAASECAAQVGRLREEDANLGRLKLRVRDKPGDQETRWELWQWYERNGQIAEGLSWLLRILMTDPANREANSAIAEYFERAGQPRRAAEHRALARSVSGVGRP